MEDEVVEVENVKEKEANQKVAEIKEVERSTNEKRIELNSQAEMIKGLLEAPQGDPRGHMVLMVSNLRHLHTMEAFQCILEGGPQVDPPFS